MRARPQSCTAGTRCSETLSLTKFHPAERDFAELTGRNVDGSPDPLNEGEKRQLKDLEEKIDLYRRNPESILPTGYGAEAFKNQADYDIKVSKIPSLKNIFMNTTDYQFYDEDGNYIGTQ